MVTVLHLNDLRVHDNPAVTRASDHDELTPLYVWDEHRLDAYGKQYKAMLRRCLKRLARAYEARGCSLTVISGRTETVIDDADKPVYLCDQAGTYETMRLINKLTNRSWATVLNDEPLYAETTSESDQLINTYFEAPITQAPEQLPANPHHGIRPSDEQPRDALDLTVFNHHAETYLSTVSNPLESRRKTTRTSHVLAAGQISLRYLHKVIRDEHGDHPVLNRLRWNLRFKQKHQHYPELRSAPINPYFEDETPYDPDPDVFNAWTNGTTGYPLVDASMRCLNQTGYLNFRMRALTASFLTHILRQPWWEGAAYMHKQLIDAEPAINHYQWQMQSNVIGSHPLRIYNPTKQAREHDSNAAFIKRWVDELNDANPEHAIEPWNQQSPPKTYLERIARYDDEQRRTTDWFAKREARITDGLLNEGAKPLLSERSKERLQRKHEKHGNDSLTNYT
jgi:deoxyribodipyrimidine photo-lyase